MNNEFNLALDETLDWLVSIKNDNTKEQAPMHIRAFVPDAGKLTSFADAFKLAKSVRPDIANLYEMVKLRGGEETNGGWLMFPMFPKDPEEKNKLLFTYLNLAKIIKPKFLFFTSEAWMLKNPPSNIQGSIEHTPGRQETIIILGVDLENKKMTMKMKPFEVKNGKVVWEDELLDQNMEPEGYIPDLVRKIFEFNAN